MRRGSGSAVACALLAAIGTAPRAGGGAPKQDRPARIIELHVGVPGLAYIGQPLPEFRKKFPKAQIVKFAGQEDAVNVTAREDGISCVAVGPPDQLKLASVGFNLDGAHAQIEEGDFRTRQGIGKGSTVNDLLETYGKPADILGEQPKGAPRRPRPGTPPPSRQKYLYANADDTVRTYFLVDNNLVTQVVVNDLRPLSQYMIKAPPKTD